MPSSTFFQNPQVNCIPRVHRIIKVIMPIFQTKNGDVKKPVNVINKVWRLEPKPALQNLLPNKKSEALAALKFQGKGEDKFKNKNTYGGERDPLGGGGCLIRKDWKITVICLVLCLLQSLFLDPNLCVRWQQKHISKCTNAKANFRLEDCRQSP